MTAPAPYTVRRWLEGTLPVTDEKIPVADLRAFADAAASVNAITITIVKSTAGTVVGLQCTVETPA